MSVSNQSLSPIDFSLSKKFSSFAVSPRSFFYFGPVEWQQKDNILIIILFIAKAHS